MFHLRDARPGDEDAVIALVTDILAEFHLALDHNGRTDLDLNDLQANYFARDGLFRVIENEAGALAGCGGLYRLSATEAEIRKMYFRPELRGLGFGRRLMEEFLAFARAAGIQQITLETASVLKSAMAMYQRFGFVEYRPAHLAARCDRAFRLRL